MFLRPMKEAHKAEARQHLRYEPVWITCDDLASEGILVRMSRLRNQECVDKTSELSIT